MNAAPTIRQASERDGHTVPDEMLEFALARVVGDQTVRAYARSDIVARRRQLSGSARLMQASTTA